MDEIKEIDQPKSEGFKELSREEVLKLSPVDRAVYKAKRDFTAFAVDFKAAGIDESQRDQVIAAAETRIRHEYAELDQQDPINRIAQTLFEVEPNNVKLLGIQYHNYLLGNLSNLQKFRGLQYSPHSYMPHELQGELGNEHFTTVAIRPDTEGKPSLRYYLPIQTGESRNYDTKELYAEGMSDQQIEDFLRKIGALEDDQSLRDLELGLPTLAVIRNAPSSPYRANGDREPMINNYNQGTMPAKTLVLDQVKTNIPGVEVQIRPYDPHQKITFILDQAALDRSLNNPNIPQR